MPIRPSLLILCCAFVLALWPATLVAAPGADPIPVADYWERVRQARDAVHAAQELAGADRRATLDEAVALLEGLDAVTLADDTVVPVDTQPLVTALNHPRPDLAELEARLAALARAAGDRGADEPPAGALARLDEIMARPEFQYAPLSAQNDAGLLQLFAQLVDLLAEFFGFVALILGLPFVRWGLVGLAVLVLAGVLYFVAREAGLFGVQTTREPEALPDEDLSSAQALQRAQDLARGGDYRTAVRYLYLSSLLFLEEAGRLRYDRALTNREYLRQVDGQADLEEPFYRVVNTFDRVWYGFKPIDERSYAEFVNQVQALRRVKIT